MYIGTNSRCCLKFHWSVTTWKKYKSVREWLMQMCLWWTYDLKFTTNICINHSLALLYLFIHLFFIYLFIFSVFLYFFLFLYICFEWFCHRCTNIVGHVSPVACQNTLQLNLSFFCRSNTFAAASFESTQCNLYDRIGQISKTLRACEIVLILQREWTLQWGK